MLRWMRNRTASSRLAAAALAVSVAACSAGSAPSTPATPIQSSTAAEETEMAGFVLSSPSFLDGGAIPTKYSCDGSNISPALVWDGAPDAAAAFALIVDDPDARGFIHWVAYNLPAGHSGGLPEGAGSAAAPPQGRNDFGRSGWGGPCPPGGTHHYRFTLYALSAQLPLTGTPTAGEVRNALSRVLIGYTTLTATYTRKK
jgi:Raf kinase inhibitor-like YbhB/YbcL family protein